MPVDAALLLRRLEPPVRLVGSLADRDDPPIETLDFAALVDRLGRGEVASGAPIDVSALASPPAEFEMRRLGLALDVLAARGARRALVVWGGRALVADVPSRRFERELDAQDSPSETVSVDAALRMHGPDERDQHRIAWPSGGFAGPIAAMRECAAPASARDSQLQLRSASSDRSSG
ncbi:MAG: hypothetical protein U0572_12095 [Phycisphaerales bacterium]